MDKGKSYTLERQSHGQDDNDNEELDLTLGLAISSQVGNRAENKHVPMMYDFLSLGGTTSINKGSFSCGSSMDYRGVSNVSGAGMIVTPLKPLGVHSTCGFGSMLSSSDKGFLPLPNSATPSSKQPTEGDGKICNFCGCMNSPVWRKGPNGPQTLCNACGLKYGRSLRKGSK